MPIHKIKNKNPNRIVLGTFFNRENIFVPNIFNDKFLFIHLHCFVDKKVISLLLLKQRLAFESKVCANMLYSFFMFSFLFLVCLLFYFVDK